MDGQPKPRVLVVGDARHGDFTRVVAELRATAQVWFVPYREHAAAWLANMRPVDWIVLLQSRPGQLPRNMPEQLRPLTGQARFVSVLGSWCEGELRTGRPWPDVPRCYWYAFPSWWQSETARRIGEIQQGHVVVSAVDRATAESLLDALAAEGFRCGWWLRYNAPPVTKGITAAIWVGGQLSGPEAIQLDSFCRHMRSERAPVLALLDFPRTDRGHLAKRIGAAEVLGKPWLLADVAQTLRQFQRLDGTVSHIRRLPIRSA